jgi:hypothetical protein
MGVSLMMMTIGGFSIAMILLVVAFWRKISWLKKLILIGVPVWFILYAIALLGFSFVSVERVLALNESKAFCGFYLDCHLHASVTEVRTAKIIGSQTAQGTFLIAKIKVFSDARNPNIAFGLIEPIAQVEDEGPRIYSRRLEAEHELPSAQIQLNQDIKGKETIEKEVVFDITEPTNKFKLSITEGFGIDKLIEAILVDDEDSIFHQPTVFGIETELSTRIHEGITKEEK